LKKESSIWAEHFFEKGQAQKWSFNSMDIITTRTESGWSLSIHNAEGQLVDEQYFLETDGFFTLFPVLPDRPLIIRPQSVLKVYPGNHIKIFVTVPLFLAAYSRNGGRESLIREVPLSSLSPTWTGDFQSGELCYSWSTPVFTSFEKATKHWDFALCCLHITNHSPSVLTLEKFMLDTRYLQVYRGATSLWCNDAEISFRGIEQSSISEIKRKTPSHELSEKTPIPPRKVGSGNFFIKTFDFFKTIYEE
jgi:hypothetical protein